MGEHDCVWDASHKSSFDPSGEYQSSPQHNSLREDNSQFDFPSTIENQESSSLRHIYHPRGIFNRNYL